MCQRRNYSYCDIPSSLREHQGRDERFRASVRSVIVLVVIHDHVDTCHHKIAWSSQDDWPRDTDPCSRPRSTPDGAGCLRSRTESAAAIQTRGHAQSYRRAPPSHGISASHEQLAMMSLLSIRPVLALAVAGALLTGCADMHRGLDAVVARNEPLAPSVKEAEAVTATRRDVKTVRPRGGPRAPASDVSEAEPAPTPVRVASAIPSPRDIFDFHPAGSASSSFRQPFIIDPNDGPLTADVRRTAVELKAFNEQMKTGTAVAARKACRETDGAAKKPGCVKPATRAAAVGTDTAIQ